MNFSTAEQAWSKEDYLDWVEYNTRQLDLVASWEQLVGIYKQLNFLDQITDEQRLKEFNSIIHSMNKQLTRMRGKLSTARDIDAAKDYLKTQFDCVKIESRQMLAYAKLKQTFVRSLLMELEGMDDGQ